MFKTVNLFILATIWNLSELHSTHTQSTVEVQQLDRICQNLRHLSQKERTFYFNDCSIEMLKNKLLSFNKYFSPSKNITMCNDEEIKLLLFIHSASLIGVAFFVEKFSISVNKLHNVYGYKASIYDCVSDLPFVQDMQKVLEKFIIKYKPNQEGEKTLKELFFSRPISPQDKSFAYLVEHPYNLLYIIFLNIFLLFGMMSRFSYTDYIPCGNMSLGLAILVYRFKIHVNDKGETVYTLNSQPNFLYLALIIIGIIVEILIILGIIIGIIKRLS